MIHQIQYISHGHTPDEQIRQIHAVLDAGQKWIQYRFKSATTKQLWDTAEQIKVLCSTYNATLIVNDHIELAKAIEANGIHLGLQDTSTKQARIELPNHIIGGTANTLSDVLMHVENGCNYVGLGPYRYTTTKQNLSPILGLKGYQEIISQLQAKDIHIPIVAIGGIQLHDIEALHQIGLHGIAISSLLQNSEDKTILLGKLKTILL